MIASLLKIVYRPYQWSPLNKRTHRSSRDGSRDVNLPLPKNIPSKKQSLNHKNVSTTSTRCMRSRAKNSQKRTYWNCFISKRKSSNLMSQTSFDRSSTTSYSCFSRHCSATSSSSCSRSSTKTCPWTWAFFALQICLSYSSWYYHYFRLPR